MASKQVQLVLTGPYAGKTIKLRDWQFVNGKFMAAGEASEVDKVVKFIGRNWQAYPAGSEKLRAVQALQQSEEEGQPDGERNHEWEVRNDSGVDSPDSVAQSAGEGSASEDADDVSGDADPETGLKRGVSGGDRHADAGLSEESDGSSDAESEGTKVVNTKLHEVIMALDPDEDEHWSESGKPALSAVAEGYGSAGLTRQEIDEAAPGWDRDKAQLRNLE